MPRTCERCDEVVSKRYFEAFSIRDEFGNRKLWSCPNCSPDGTQLTGPDQKTGSKQYDEDDWGKERW